MTPEDRFKQLGSADASSPSEAEWLEFRAAAHKSLTRRRIAAAVGGVGLVVALIAGSFAVANLDTGDERGPGVAGTPTVAPTDDTDDPTPAPSDPPETPLDPVDREMPMPLNQWYIETDGTLTPFAYFLYRPVSPRSLLDQTMAVVPGPLGETGVTTAIPGGNRLAHFAFEGSTAVVDIRGELPQGRDLRMAQGQIVYTITQFEGIERVDLTWEGNEHPDLTREDFHELLPPIVVEFPTDGQEVGRTFTLSGIANVFEATVSWRLVGVEERYEKEGFTTATCGTGCWGTFSEKITYDGSEDRVTLQVFQSSAEDGSPMNMVEIPLNVRN